MLSGLVSASGPNPVTYGMEAIHLHNNVNKLESYQGSVIKHICGLSKRSHHTNLVRAFGLENISTIIGNHTINLYKRICSSYSAIQHLCFHSIYQYVCHNVIVPGTMLGPVAPTGRKIYQQVVKFTWS